MSVFSTFKKKSKKNKAEINLDKKAKVYVCSIPDGHYSFFVGVEGFKFDLETDYPVFNKYLKQNGYSFDDVKVEIVNSFDTILEALKYKDKLASELSDDKKLITEYLHCYSVYKTTFSDGKYLYTFMKDVTYNSMKKYRIKQSQKPYMTAKNISECKNKLLLETGSYIEFLLLRQELREEASENPEYVGYFVNGSYPHWTHSAKDQWKVKKFSTPDGYYFFSATKDSGYYLRAPKAVNDCSKNFLKENNLSIFDLKSEILKTSTEKNCRSKVRRLNSESINDPFFIGSICGTKYYTKKYEEKKKEEKLFKDEESNATHCVVKIKGLENKYCIEVFEIDEINNIYSGNLSKINEEFVQFLEYKVHCLEENIDILYKGSEHNCCTIRNQLAEKEEQNSNFIRNNLDTNFENLRPLKKGTKFVNHFACGEVSECNFKNPILRETKHGTYYVYKIYFTGVDGDTGEEIKDKDFYSVICPKIYIEGSDNTKNPKEMEENKVYKGKILFQEEVETGRQYLKAIYIDNSNDKEEASTKLVKKVEKEIEISDEEVNDILNLINGDNEYWRKNFVKVENGDSFIYVVIFPDGTYTIHYANGKFSLRNAYSWRTGDLNYIKINDFDISKTKRKVLKNFNSKTECINYFNKLQEKLNLIDSKIIIVNKQRVDNNDFNTCLVKNGDAFIFKATLPNGKYKFFEASGIKSLKKSRLYLRKFAEKYGFKKEEVHGEFIKKFSSKEKALAYKKELGIKHLNDSNFITHGNRNYLNDNFDESRVVNGDNFVYKVIYSDDKYKIKVATGKTSVYNARNHFDSNSLRGYGKKQIRKELIQKFNTRKQAFKYKEKLLKELKNDPNLIQSSSNKKDTEKKPIAREISQNITKPLPALCVYKLTFPNGENEFGYTRVKTLLSDSATFLDSCSRHSCQPKDVKLEIVQEGFKSIQQTQKFKNSLTKKSTPKKKKKFKDNKICKEHFYTKTKNPDLIIFEYPSDVKKADCLIYKINYPDGTYDIDFTSSKNSLAVTKNKLKKTNFPKFYCIKDDQVIEEVKIEIIEKFSSRDNFKEYKKNLIKNRKHSDNKFIHYEGKDKFKNQNIQKIDYSGSLSYFNDRAVAFKDNHQKKDHYFVYKLCIYDSSILKGKIFLGIYKYTKDVIYISEIIDNNKQLKNLLNEYKVDKKYCGVIAEDYNFKTYSEAASYKRKLEKENPDIYLKL